MAGNSVDIIIPVFNETVLTKNCLESVLAASDTPYRLILIDNASAVETENFLKDFALSHKNVILIRNETNVGWVKAVNQGIRASSGAYVCVMNNDTVVKTPGWLAGLIAVSGSADDIGLINPRFKVKSNIAQDKPYIEIDFCRGYCILVKRAVIDKIGGLDEAYGLGYYDDDDFSVRAIRSGFRCVRVNSVVVEHLKDSTFSTVFKDDVRRALHEKNKQLFYKKWGRRLNIVFIASKTSDRKKLKEILLFLARRQHIIYLWNFSSPLDVEHINIREKLLPPIFPATVCELALYLNLRKKEAKHYDLVFVDDLQLGAKLSKNRQLVYCIDAGRDADKIVRIADTTARCRVDEGIGI